MLGLMQQRPLLLSSLIEYAERYHGERDDCFATVRWFHSPHVTTREVGARARRIANALGRLGVVRGDRVATLSWNGFRHLELYFGVTGSGTILHTVNPRLFPEQIHYIIDHAEGSLRFLRSGLRLVGRGACSPTAACARLRRTLRTDRTARSERS